MKHLNAFTIAITFAVLIAIVLYSGTESMCSSCSSSRRRHRRGEHMSIGPDQLQYMLMRPTYANATTKKTIP